MSLVTELMVEGQKDLYPIIQMNAVCYNWISNHSFTKIDVKKIIWGFNILLISKILVRTK